MKIKTKQNFLKGNALEISILPSNKSLSLLDEFKHLNQISTQTKEELNYESNE